MFLYLPSSFPIAVDQPFCIEFMIIDMGSPNHKIPSLEILEILLIFLSQPRNAITSGKKCPIFHWPVIFFVI